MSPRPPSRYRAYGFALARACLAGWRTCVHHQPGLVRLFTRLSARYPLEIGPGDAVFAGDSYRPDYLGPVQAGMPSFLIDPGQVYEVPGNCRLASVFDVPTVLEANQGERRAVLRV